VGLLAQQRLAVMMAEVGLVQGQGSSIPESESDFREIVAQAMSAVRRYAGSAIIAPVVSPRGQRSNSAGCASVGSASTGAAVVPAAPSSHSPDDLPMFSFVALSEYAQEGVLELAADPSVADDDTPKLHACKNCQRAKTACMDQRPCARCVRLQMLCDNEIKTVKRACANCKRAKVKCNLDDENPCRRCKRLGLKCPPHVPNKKKRLQEPDDLETFSGASVAALPLPTGSANAWPEPPMAPTADMASAGMTSAARPQTEQLPTELLRGDDLCSLLMQQENGSGQLTPPVPAVPPAVGHAPLLTMPNGHAATLSPPGDGGPILSMAEVLRGEGWALVQQDGNVRLSSCLHGGRMLWCIATDMPVPPAMVAAGIRHLLSNWGSEDPLVRSIEVLSQGGGVPAWVANCSCCFEQVLYANVASTTAAGVLEPRDFVLHSVWMIVQGAHTCSIRPTVDDAAPLFPGVLRSSASVDTYVLPNQVEPNGSLVYAVLDAGDMLNDSLVAANPKQLVQWTRRAQEAAMMLHREGASARQGVTSGRG